MPSTPAEFKNSQTVAIVSAHAGRRRAWSVCLAAVANLVVAGMYDTLQDAQNAGVPLDAVLVDMREDGRRRQDPDGPALSPRENEVMGLLAGGSRDKELPARLHVTAHTARTFLRRAMAKLGATSRSEAVAIWSRLRAGGMNDSAA